MFRRLFWFATGTLTGIWATVRVNRALRRMAPDSLALTAAERAVELGGRARQFARDVRTGMTQREHELTEALGLQDSEQARPALPGPRPQPAQPAQNVYRHDPRSVHSSKHARQVYEQKEGH